MKTQKSMNAKIFILGIAFTILCAPLNMFALGYKKPEVTKLSPKTITPASDSLKLQLQHQIEITSAAINKWVSNSVSKEVGNFILEKGSYKATIQLVINENGEVIHFKTLNTKDEDFHKKVSEILTKAPNFGSFNTNGSPARFLFNLPITYISR